jgi:hypothetical protein
MADRNGLWVTRLPGETLSEFRTRTKAACPLCEAGETPFLSRPGKLFDSVQNAARWLGSDRLDLFPAGYRYTIEVVRKSAGRGMTAVEMAAIVATDNEGNFVGYCQNPEKSR